MANDNEGNDLGFKKLNNKIIIEMSYRDTDSNYFILICAAYVGVDVDVCVCMLLTRPFAIHSAEFIMDLHFISVLFFIRPVLLRRLFPLIIIVHYFDQTNGLLKFLYVHCILKVC